MKKKKQYYDYIKEWKAENTDRIQAAARKELDIPNRIEMALACNVAKSKSDYIVGAILQRLERDGF